jgi:hypothetical protein
MQNNDRTLGKSDAADNEKLGGFKSYIQTNNVG